MQRVSAFALTTFVAAQYNASWNNNREPLFHTCVESLLKHGLVGRGSLVDAGANDGAETAWLAQLHPGREVLSFEPLRENYKVLKELTAKLPNVVATNGGLGAEMTNGSYPAYLDYMGSGWAAQLSAPDQQMHLKHSQIIQARRAPVARHSTVSFPIVTIDSLFANDSSDEPRRLAFAHWDVEGFEMDVLAGARATLVRDRPFFTIESLPQSRPAHHAKMVAFIAELGYMLAPIPESCGSPEDCRNLLAVPEERLRARECRVLATSCQIFHNRSCAAQNVSARD